MITYEELSRRRQAGRDLFKRYYAGERNFVGIDLRNVHKPGRFAIEIDLSGANLQHSCFAGMPFIRANLTGTNLCGTDFSGSRMNYILLRGANLINAKLVKADLTGADLTGVDLTGADLTGAILRDTDLTGIRISEETIFQPSIMPDGSVRDNYPFRVLSGDKFLKLYQAGERNFEMVSLYRTNLSEIDLRGINLNSARLSNVNLRGVNLSDSELGGVQFLFCDLRDTLMRNCDFSGSSYIFCDLRMSERSGKWACGSYIKVNLKEAETSGGSEDPPFYFNVIRKDGKFVAGPTETLYKAPSKIDWELRQ